MKNLKYIAFFFFSKSYSFKLYQHEQAPKEENSYELGTEPENTFSGRGNLLGI